MFRAAVSLPFVVLTLVGSGVNLVPTPLDAQGTIRGQWEHSPHALSMDTPEEIERMNRTGCAHCHTAQGYHQVTMAGLESTAPYSDVVGLTCEACHEDGPAPGRLRAGSAREACRGCHDELVSSEPDALEWCSQYGIFEGSGGREAVGQEYGVAAHTDLPGGCVACHMAPAGAGADPSLVGGHTFRVKTKGDLPPAFNPGPCRPCHGEMSVDRLERSQEGVRELLVTLAELLPQKEVPGDPTATEPRYPVDPALDPTQARASHNYWLVQKDGSFGVHNPVYTRDLLTESILALQGGA